MGSGKKTKVGRAALKIPFSHWDFGRSHLLTRSCRPKASAADSHVVVDEEALRAQAVNCRRILEVLHGGALMLDEVDMILHPLKSELNWPLGLKQPLDFTRGAQVGPKTASLKPPNPLLPELK